MKGKSDSTAFRLAAANTELASLKVGDLIYMKNTSTIVFRVVNIDENRVSILTSKGVLLSLLHTTIIEGASLTPTGEALAEILINGAPQ